MKLPTRMTSFAAAAVLCASGAAQATAITAGMSNFQFTLIDLTPDDGVAATYSLGLGSTTLDTSGAVPAHTLTVPLGQAGAVEAQYGDFRMSASTTGAVGALQVGYLDAGASLRDELPFHASAVQQVAVTLAPNSMLLLNGNAFTDVTSWVGDEVSAQLSVGIGTHGTGPEVGFSRHVHPTTIPNDSNRAFQIGYANPWDTAITVQLTVESYMTVQPLMSVTAVPEPSSWAMLGTGLAAVGVFARRRQQAGKA